MTSNTVPIARQKKNSKRAEELDECVYHAEAFLIYCSLLYDDDYDHDVAAPTVNE